jgi:NAD(P)-dependent dehydrogenase (short-subunit alcohol dehydrogenase family)
MAEHRIFVVTGAGTGIGRAIALRLARDGAHLALMARNTDRLDQTAADVVAIGGRATVHGCDIRDGAQVDQAFAAAAADHGPLHGLIANSGIGGPNEAGAADRFADLVQTNLVGTYQCLRAAQRHLAEGPGPRHLVVIASILARFGVPGYTGYCASKTALLGLVRALALEVATDGVQVNALCPGWVETDMAWEGIDGMAAAMGISRSEAHDIAMRQVPIGRMGQPDQVAGTVAWLLSPDGAGVTGQGIDINGGAWMG